MVSSDDEPLAVIAASKKLNPNIYKEDFNTNINDTKVRKRKKNKKMKKILKIRLPNIRRKSPQIIERPMDVWLYLTDLNPAGPYSCLLCSEWFINRSKLIVHYVINHRKDYCGICRYFVPDRDAWLAHKKFHVPWNCSQCSETFESEENLRKHFSEVHHLVHCRLCFFMMSDNEEYHSHLFQKHNVTNIANRETEFLWEMEYDGSPKFICLLCSGSTVLVSDFFKHFVCFHHFTLKCITSILSGRDLPFSVYGVNISPHFLETQLKDHMRYGYIDPEQKMLKIEADKSCIQPWQGLEPTVVNPNLLDALIPEIKQENLSDHDDAPDENKDTKNNIQRSAADNIFIENYKGDEDFDVTLIELMLLQKSSFDYIDMILQSIAINVIPKLSDIDYTAMKSEQVVDVDCPLCFTKYQNMMEFCTHLCKMHGIKSVPAYSCRVCSKSFESDSELTNHMGEEMAEFEDLWLCQFCDKEFDDRMKTREHLTEHWTSIDIDNCFSPHLGFKCRYCPTLFWNEGERESHQNRVHMSKHKEDFYRCASCSEIFSDKVWFIHHYWTKHVEDETSSPLYVLKCRICCLVLVNVNDMRQHFNSEHPEAKKLFCSLDACKFKPFNQSKSFKLHLKTMHCQSIKPPDAALTCTVCGREFNNAKACGTHMSLAHGPGRFKCKLCYDTLQSSDERKLHYLIRHPGKHPFECNVCGKSFQYKSSLYMHRNDHHTANKIVYTCSYCNKEFNKKDSFREHVLIHEGPRHACSYCPMRFVQRSNMLRHERRHTGERPYSCVHCGRTFADKGACNSHMRTHSRDSFHICIYCGQTFVQKSKLKYHIRKHTGENLETCSICSKLFTSVCSLREHMKIHQKKQRVRCPICDRQYQDERYMLRHLRATHSEAGQYACPLCEKCLNSAVALRHHVITHSRRKLFQCLRCNKSYSVKKSILRHLRKRHRIKADQDSVKEFYKKLDARECQLGLDEATITSIFGPPRLRNTDVMIGNFVTFPKQTPVATINQKNNDVREKSDHGDELSNNGNSDIEDRRMSNAEADSDDGLERKSKTTKSNHNSGSEMEETEEGNELEPTSFVNVKLEPLSLDEEYDN